MKYLIKYLKHLNENSQHIKDNVIRREIRKSFGQAIFPRHLAIIQNQINNLSPYISLAPKQLIKNEDEEDGYIYYTPGYDIIIKQYDYYIYLYGTFNHTSFKFDREDISDICNFTVKTLLNNSGINWTIKQLIEKYKISEFTLTNLLNAIISEMNIFDLSIYLQQPRIEYLNHLYKLIKICDSASNLENIKPFKEFNENTLKYFNNLLILKKEEILKSKEEISDKLDIIQLYTDYIINISDILALVKKIITYLLSLFHSKELSSDDTLKNNLKIIISYLFTFFKHLDNINKQREEKNKNVDSEL